MPNNTQHLPHTQENGFKSLIFNIAIPVLILNKGSKYMDPKLALAVALAFPLGYGIWDYLQKRKVNPISFLGLLNVAITGGLAIAGLNGFWFSIKEAAFPLLVGAFVFASSFSENPFISQLFLNPQVFKLDLIEQKILEFNRQNEFKVMLKNATQLLSGSFLLSAILNFILAEQIFIPIDPGLTDLAKSEILNGQIAKMTTWSMAVILLPSILFLVGILFYTIRNLQKITNLTQDELWQK